MTRARNAARALIPAALRAKVMRHFGSNQLFRSWIENTGELDVISEECGRLAPGEPWQDFAGDASTVKMTERVVEIPWILSRYRGEQCVLDVGPAYAVTWYTRQLVAAGIRELHGIDLKPVHIKGMKVAAGDVRRLPYEDEYFDLINCISTLEHVGLENLDQYGAIGPIEQGGDVQGLREFRRTLKPDGRVLITVPFGELQTFSWMRQYDLASWTELLAASGFKAVETARYSYSRGRGWRYAGTPTGTEIERYQGDGAPAATSVLCASLQATSDSI